MIYFERIRVINSLKQEHAWAIIKNYTTQYSKVLIIDKVQYGLNDVCSYIINRFCSKYSLEEIYINQFDKLNDHLERALQEDCYKWAPGIEIHFVQAAKPKIPSSLLQNYEIIEHKRTMQKILIEQYNVAKTKAETKRAVDIIKALTEADVMTIKINQQINETIAMIEIQNILSKLDERIRYCKN